VHSGPANVHRAKNQGVDRKLTGNFWEKRRSDEARVTKLCPAKELKGQSLPRYFEVCEATNTSEDAP
jgi:hypothetical protein